MTVLIIFIFPQGNFPDSCKVDGLLLPPGQDEQEVISNEKNWKTLVPLTKVSQPSTPLKLNAKRKPPVHFYFDLICNSKAVFLLKEDVEIKLLFPVAKNKVGGSENCFVLLFCNLIGGLSFWSRVRVTCSNMTMTMSMTEVRQ
jgi:hypothetical protein